MPDVIYAMLLAVCEYDHWDRNKMTALSGYCANSLEQYFSALYRLGWVERIRYNDYMLTERGKIALAIETGRRSKLQFKRRMRSYRRQRVNDFREGYPL